MFCPVPLLSCPVTITDNGNGKGQKGWDICPLPLPFDVSVSKKVNFFYKPKR